MAAQVRQAIAHGRAARAEETHGRGGTGRAQAAQATPMNTSTAALNPPTTVTPSFMSPACQSSSATSVPRPRP